MYTLRVTSEFEDPFLFYFSPSSFKSNANDVIGLYIFQKAFSKYFKDQNAYLTIMDDRGQYYNIVLKKFGPFTEKDSVIPLSLSS